MGTTAPKDSPRPQRGRAAAADTEAAQPTDPTALPSEQGITLTRTEVIEVPPVPAGMTVPSPSVSSDQNGQVAIVQSVANLMLEYMAASVPTLPTQFGNPHGIGQAAGIHVLPHYIDELEQDWGIDIYLKMLWDAQVKACDSTLRDAILDRPLQVVACEDEYTRDNEQQTALATTVADFVRANIDGLSEGFMLVSWEMLEGMALGYKLAELVFEIREIVPGNGPQTCIKDIATKPQEAVSIIVDQYNNELGYLPRLQGVGLWGGWEARNFPGVSSTNEDGTEREMVDIPGLVPPEKIVRFTWQPRNRDPRGTSNLRAAYVPWRLKIGLYPAYEAYLARFAQPSTKLELGGGEVPPMVDSNGQPIVDPALKIAALLSSLVKFQAGGAMVVPTGKLDLVQAEGEGEVYLKAFELVDQQITKSILMQDLATEGGKYGTKALGEVHQDTLGLLVQMGKQVYISCVRERIVKTLVRLNYGEAGLRVLPTLSFGETEQQDFSTTVQALMAMVGTGTPDTRLLFPKNYNDALEMVHMEPLPEDLIAKLDALVQEQITAAIQVAQDPMGMKAQAEMADQQAAADEQAAAEEEAGEESYY